MNKVKIITDGCSDIPKYIREQYDIDYVKLSLIWNGEEKPASCDWDVYTAKEFYDAMRAGATIKSNQVAITAFEEIFNKYLDEGMDILYIGCTSALSGSVSTGRVIAKRICELRPEANITVIDPPIACGGETLLAIEAAKLAAQGLPLAEIAEKIEKLAKTAFQVGTIDTLVYLKRAGRVSAPAAFFGNLFGIKPIIVNDERGANVAIKKVSGRKNALEFCVNMLAEGMLAEDNEYPASEQTVYIGHADCIDAAEQLKARIEELIHPRDIIINDIGPCIGASVGPSMIGLYAFGKPESLKK